MKPIGTNTSQMKSKPTISRLFIWILSMTIFYGCISEKEYIIESDYSYDGNFKRYKSFDFLKNSNIDTAHDHELLKKTMIKRLRAQGYVNKEKKPDLLVSYKIFHDDFFLNGFSQPNFENWIGENAFLKDDPSQELIPVSSSEGEKDSSDEDDEAREGEYIERKYQMNEGTLFVAFYDRKRRKTIWQGYASGVFARSDYRSDRSINAAASKIFDEFRLIADGFLLK